VPQFNFKIDTKPDRQSRLKKCKGKIEKCSVWKNRETPMSGFCLEVIDFEMQLVPLDI